jgi:hypothetical protein
MSAEKDIFRFLKKHGAANFETIVLETGINASEVNDFLDRYVSDGIIGINDEGVYRIKYVLDPPLKPEPLSTKYYSYERIQEEIQKGGGIPIEYQDVPSKWRNPNIKYLPTHVDQGDRGTCVGFATAIGLTLLYFQITGDVPSAAELADIKRNIEEQLGCPNAKPLIRDNFGRRWKSPQFLYDRSREEGGVTEPSGSYLSASVAAAKKYGSVFETECWTSKTPYCVANFYPVIPGETGEQSKQRILALGAQHKTNGYATIVDFNAFCAAIYNQWKNKTGGGFGLVPINIFENYTQNGSTGMYPDPRGEVVGSHAQCVVGYDMDAGTLEFWQSWGFDWSSDGGITKKYWDQAAGTAFVILDDTEARVGQDIYSRVTITSNVPLANYTINGENHAANDAVIALERGKLYTVIAFPLDPTTVKETSITITTVPTLDATEVNFVFTAKTIPPTPGAGIIAAIVALLKKIWDLLTLKK